MSAVCLACFVLTDHAWLTQDSLEVAKKVKEMYSYVCPDIAKEFAKYDEKPDKYFKTFSGTKVCLLLSPCDFES